MISLLLTKPSQETPKYSPNKKSHLMTHLLMKSNNSKETKSLETDIIMFLSYEL